MGVVRATVRDGMIVADAPADWPEGMAVDLVLTVGSVGVTEEEQGDDPESIARWVEWAEGLRPFLTQQEEAAWQADRKARREWELAHFYERAEKLRKMWDGE